MVILETPWMSQICLDSLNNVHRLLEVNSAFEEHTVSNNLLLSSGGLAGGFGLSSNLLRIITPVALQIAGTSFGA